ncbi:hypothetical protein HDE_12850 [Halotydeus destructor]|nr:hypothetical protein HDE_12850 [Halotydeus destructor]
MFKSVTAVIAILCLFNCPSDGADMASAFADVYQFVCRMLTMIYQLNDRQLNMSCEYEPTANDNNTEMTTEATTEMTTAAPEVSASYGEI